jgi:hypothetical protein
MSSSSAIAPPSIAASVTVKLSATNFVMWQAQILTHLRGHCLLGHIDGSLDSPSETIFTNTDVGRSEVVNPDYATWYVRDQVVLGGFFSTVTEEVPAHIMNVPTARAAWVILERMFASRSRAQVIQIRSQLTAVKPLADTLAAIGQPLREEEIIYYILAGLGLNYDSLVTSLSVKDDLTLDEVYSHLLAYEHRHDIQDSDYGIGNGSSVNFTHRNNPGRGGGQGGGRGGQSGHPAGGRGNGDGGRGHGQGRGGSGRGRTSPRLSDLQQDQPHRSALLQPLRPHLRRR